jgi:hypothetical protein
VTKRQVARLRAVAVISADSTGETRFDGTPPEIARDAAAFVPRGAATWHYETRTGARYPFPQEAPPRQPPSGEDSRQESAFYLAERMMEINAKVYRDAYAQVGNLMGNVLDSYAQALVALSNRLADTEATISDMQAILSTRAVQGEKDENDQLAGKVIDHMFAASAGAPQNGKTAASSSPASSKKTPS